LAAVPLLSYRGLPPARSLPTSRKRRRLLRLARCAWYYRAGRFVIPRMPPSAHLGKGGCHPPLASPGPRRAARGPCPKGAFGAPSGPHRPVVRPPEPRGRDVPPGTLTGVFGTGFDQGRFGGPSDPGPRAGPGPACFGADRPCAMRYRNWPRIRPALTAPRLS